VCDYRRDLERAITEIAPDAPVQAHLRRKLDAVIAEQEDRARLAMREHDVTGLAARQLERARQTVAERGWRCQASRVGGYLVNVDRLAHDEKTPTGSTPEFTGLGRLIPGS